MDIFWNQAFLVLTKQKQAQETRLKCFCVINWVFSRYDLLLINLIAGETVVLDPEPACQYLLGPVLSSYYAKYVIMWAL